VEKNVVPLSWQRRPIVPIGFTSTPPVSALILCITVCPVGMLAIHGECDLVQLPVLVKVGNMAMLIA